MQVSLTIADQKSLPFSTISRSDCFSLAVTSLRFGKGPLIPISVSPALLQLEHRFLILFAVERFRATQIALSLPTGSGSKSDDSRVKSWSSFIFQLPIGISTKVETVHLAEALKTPAVGLVALYPLTGNLYLTITQFTWPCAQELLLSAHQGFSLVFELRSSNQIYCRAPSSCKLCSHDTAEGCG